MGNSITSYHDDNGACSKEPGRCQESQEWVMVSNTDTVINPRAVMVVALHANVTDGTVSGSSRPNDLAIWTQICWTKFLQEFQKFEGWFRSKFPWISPCGQTITDSDNNR